MGVPGQAGNDEEEITCLSQARIAFCDPDLGGRIIRTRKAYRTAPHESAISNQGSQNNNHNNERSQPQWLASFVMSGWQDSNLRPPRPKRGAMTGLRYTPSPMIQGYSPKLECKYRGKFLLSITEQEKISRFLRLIFLDGNIDKIKHRNNGHIRLNDYV